MRAAVLLCAALALADPPAAAAANTALALDQPHRPSQHTESNMLESPPPLRMDHIKRQILAKLGLSSRPVPQRAPPRDVVRQILSRAADPTPAPRDHEHSEREIIAIAHRGIIAKSLKLNLLK